MPALTSGKCWAPGAGAGWYCSALGLRQALPVPALATGNDHLVMLTNDGDLYTLGCGEQGQLGRVPELFANRGGRQGLGKWLWYLWWEDLVSPPLVKLKGRWDSVLAYIQCTSSVG